MQTKSHHHIHQLGEDHWYFQNKRDLFNKIIAKYQLHPRTCLELGAGIGANMPWLTQLCPNAKGIELSPTAVKLAHQRGHSQITQGNALTYQSSQPFDFVICSDLLEHVDDHQLLTNVSSLLTPNGYLLITVPAFSWLWSHMDHIAHHRRRYTKPQLASLLTQHDYHIIHINYWHTWAVLPALLHLWIKERCLDKLLRRPPQIHLNTLPTALNTHLVHLGVLENTLSLSVHLPFGVGLIALARKP